LVAKLCHEVRRLRLRAAGMQRKPVAKRLPKLHSGRMLLLALYQRILVSAITDY
jgi:hypothetical protein